ncbi:AAA family ATPase [Ensifer sp. BR816]|uniref:AAA family ATPase n=1 Tax=Rhizobium sp. (strain BR816) TaxID=1057002 RepID=UPI00036437B8|nr:AAA family ATPase [Ensifer sp. BR816]
MTSEGLRETTPSGDAQSVAGQLLPKGIRFVEFYGLPGIGKTTASSVLAARLQQGGCVVDEKRITWEDKPLLARQVHRVGLVLPRLVDREFRSIAARIVRYIAQGGQEKPIDLIRWTWHLWSVAAYLQEERSKGAAVTILDQGLLQGFWSVLLKSRDRKTSEHWLDILSAIGVDDIVFVDLRGGIDLAQDRLRGRDDRASRLQRGVPDGEGALWTKAERAYRKMAADLRRSAKASDRIPTLATVDVTASTSPQEVADATLSAVRLAYRGRYRQAASESR